MQALTSPTTASASKTRFGGGGGGGGVGFTSSTTNGNGAAFGSFGYGAAPPSSTRSISPRPGTRHEGEGTVGRLPSG